MKRIIDIIKIYYTSDYWRVASSWVWYIRLVLNKDNWGPSWPLRVIFNTTYILIMMIGFPLSVLIICCILWIDYKLRKEGEELF